MCLIELKNAIKPILSCTVTAKSCLNNNTMYTNSPLVKKTREGILEFFLLNHPLDCPVCDQGGECDLQDLSLFYGISTKRFFNYKRAVTNKSISPIIKTIMTRCIHCTRCVRFSIEIAGTGDLGMFGRGVSSEISTYINNKFFQSELSGNVIDLCPVGALTVKPYSFTSRSWELTTIKSIDFTDGFATYIMIYLKNNIIVKLLSDMSKNIEYWITDKTRFSFDGMFSPDRSFEIFRIERNRTMTYYQIMWETVFEEIIVFLYFQDHLNYHTLIKTIFTIVFDATISLENLNILILLSKRFRFIKLRKSKSFVGNTDLECEFLLTDSINGYNLDKSAICILLGVNTRYEGADLNLRLRRRTSKGDLKVVSFSSSVNLTFYNCYEGLNLKIFKTVIEGNNNICQILLHSLNPFFIVGSDIYQRNYSSKIIRWFDILKDLMCRYHYKFNGINVLQCSVNSAGINYFGFFNEINKLEIINSNILYFFNTTLLNIKLLKKIVKLKLSELFKDSFCLNKIILEQTSGIRSLVELSSGNFNVSTYLSLPSSNFFEETNTYFNSEGFFRKAAKFISNRNQTKSNWQIVKKLLLMIKCISFLAETKKLIHFGCNKKYNFCVFTSFHYSNNLNRRYDNFISTTDKRFYNTSRHPSYIKKKVTVSDSNIVLCLYDFYIGAEDNYTKQSSIMAKCSKLFRSSILNF